MLALARWDAAVVVAFISASASVVGGYFALRASMSGKRAADNTETTNGHTSGELIEDIHDRLGRVELHLFEHIRDHERDRLG